MEQRSSSGFRKTFQANNLCPDYVENEGHYFGATLSADDKYALTEFLKTL